MCAPRSRLTGTRNRFPPAIARYTALDALQRTPGQAPRASRTYASASAAGGAPAASGLAPYFLGAGLAGSALFYYSTRDQRALKADESPASATAKAAGSGGAKTIQGYVDEKGHPPAGPAALSSDEFRPLTISEILPYNHNTSRFVFDLPEGTSSGLTVASALVVKAAKEGECLNDQGKPVIRPYTPVTAPDVEGKLVRRSSLCCRSCSSVRAHPFPSPRRNSSSSTTRTAPSPSTSSSSSPVMPSP